MSDQSINGRVIEILKPESGTSKAGKEWNKQEFVIETNDQYPKKVCFTLFGDKTDLLMKIDKGMDVDVSYNLESREYNGRWFHNVNAWKIIIDEASNSARSQSDIPTPPPPPEPAADSEGDLPF